MYVQEEKHQIINSRKKCIAFKVEYIEQLHAILHLIKVCIVHLLMNYIPNLK